MAEIHPQIYFQAVFLHRGCSPQPRALAAEFAKLQNSFPADGSSRGKWAGVETVGFKLRASAAAGGLGDVLDLAGDGKAAADPAQP